jgi:hypothetical protein
MIDVVEGTALASLPHMLTVLDNRPPAFPSLKAALDWGHRSGEISLSQLCLSQSSYRFVFRVSSPHIVKTLLSHLAVEGVASTVSYDIVKGLHSRVQVLCGEISRGGLKIRNMPVSHVVPRQGSPRPRLNEWSLSGTLSFPQRDAVTWGEHILAYPPMCDLHPLSCSSRL